MAAQHLNLTRLEQRLALKLEQELESTRKARVTSRLLKIHIFQIVKRALTEMFGENHSYCCLQSSVAIVQVLAKFGINATLVKGAVCLPCVTKGERFSGGWHGFWGRYHHFWVVTEFGELVDLTVAQINRHPALPSDSCVDPYPVWTNDKRFLSTVFHYVPEETTSVELLGGEIDRSSLERLLHCAGRHQDSFDDATVEVGSDFENSMKILEGMSTYEAFANAHDEWAGKTRMVIDSGEPIPEWFANQMMRLKSLNP